MHAAGAEAGQRWLIAPGTEASLLAVANRHWRGSSVSNDELGLRFEWRHSFGRRILLNFNGSWGARNWNVEPDRDGPVVNLGFGVRYQATPVLVLNTSIFGVRDRPDQATRRTRTYEPSLGLNRDLPRGFTIGLEASLNRTRYDEFGLSTTDGGRREDRTTGLSANLTKRDLTIGGFSPRLTLGHAVRESNAVFQAYWARSCIFSCVQTFHPTLDFGEPCIFASSGSGERKPRCSALSRKRAQ